MEIIDITFNFEMYEEAVLMALKKFNECVDDLGELKEVWECSGRLDEIEKHDTGFQEYYNMFYQDGGEMYKIAHEQARNDIKRMIINKLADFNVIKKQMKSSFNLYITLMCARVEYIQTTNSQDELYGNYKLRTEWNDLKRKIKKFENLRNVSEKISEDYTLSSFGLEIDGEQEME